MLISLRSHQMYILSASRVRAQRYITSHQVAKGMRAFDCGSALDPLFYWSLMRTPFPKNLLVLQDWYLESKEEPSGTVAANVQYVQHCWDNPCWNEQRTFHRLFHGKESRQLLEAGNTMVLNASWGLRKRSYFDETCGPLPSAIHLEGLALWLWLASEYKVDRIYLPGGWARINTSLNSGDILGVPEYLNARSLSCPVADIARNVLRETRIHLLDHPSYRSDWLRINVRP
jgi:hypothetical protein